MNNHSPYQAPPLYYHPDDVIASQRLLYFKKNCNHTAKALILHQVISLGLMFVLMYGYIFITIFLAMMNAGSASIDTENMMNSLLINMIQGDQYIFLLISYLGANLFAAWLCARKTGVNLKGLFRGAPAGWKLTAASFVGNFGIQMVNYLFLLLLNLALGILGLQYSSESSLPTRAGGLAAYIIYVCIIAPITEELLCRGVLLKALSRYGTKFAIITSAMVFGLMHGNLTQTPFAFLIGLLYGYLAVRTGSIRLPILLHITNNTFSTVLALIGGRLSEDSPAMILLNLGTMLLFAVCLIVFIVILVKQRKKLQFTSKDPESAKQDNLIPIDQPLKKYFSRGAILVIYAVYVITMIATTIPAIKPL